MSYWNPNRSPDVFPARWHEILKERPGLFLVEMSDDPAFIKRSALKFNALKACLRNHPLHVTTGYLKHRNYRLSKESHGNKHSLWVTITWADEYIKSVEQALYDAM